MIVCAACGTENRDDARFCADCGAFLEWEGAPVGPVNTADPTVPTAPATGTVGSAIPVEVQPTEAPRRRPVQPPRAAVHRGPLPGEVACPTCGSGNEPSRRFCRSCGALLAHPEAVRLSWWRRLRNRLARRRGYAAGERRRRRDNRATRRLLAITAALCLVVIAVLAAPLIRRGVADLRDMTGAHVPIRPDGFGASSFLREAPPANVTDGATNRYWAPQGEAAGSWVEVLFTRPVRLLDIVVTGGVGTDQERFLRNSRPHELDVVATAPGGATIRKTLTLRDEPGPQHFAFEAHDTVRVRFFVKSTYGPAGTPSVAIGELEFFGRT
jgi:hypothetical protein